MARPMLDNTIQLLDVLDDNQLQAINAVARAFVTDSPYRPKSEEELLERIDHSLKQADEGMLQDADEAIDELVAELNL